MQSSQQALFITYHFRIPWKGLKHQIPNMAAQAIWLLTILEFPGRDWNWMPQRWNMAGTNTYHFRIPWKGLKLMILLLLQNIYHTYHFRIPWKGLKHRSERALLFYLKLTILEFPGRDWNINILWRESKWLHLPF